MKAHLFSVGQSVALCAIVTSSTGCEGLLGRSVTPKQIREGTCALLEAAKLACQLAEVAGKPCPFEPPGCTAYERAEEAKARRERDGQGGDVLAGEDEPCKPVAAPSPASSAPKPALE